MTLRDLQTTTKIAVNTVVCHQSGLRIYYE